MKNINLSLVQTNPTLYDDIKSSLEGGGLICFPTPSGYKLGADFSSPKAILGMIQAKRRIKNAPSLVLVPNESWVDQVASSVSDEAKTLMKAFWPGPLTLLLEANQELPSKIKKSLTGAKGWLGVRVPDDEVSQSIVNAFGRPMLVSSANLAKKHGDNSVQQIKKNFGRTVDIMIDAGDLNSPTSSTLIDMTKNKSSIIRAGTISEEAILQALA